jgi:hypothetical protein
MAIAAGSKDFLYQIALADARSRPSAPGKPFAPAIFTSKGFRSVEIEIVGF